MSADYNPSEFVTIPDGWDCRRLLDCTADKTISYGIVQPGQHYDEGVPIIRVNNINNGRVDLREVLRVSPAIEAKYKRTRLKGGEVLLTLVGSTGQSVIARDELVGWNVPRAIAVIRPSDDVGSEWIDICLQSSNTKHFLDVRANTTVQKTLNLKDVRDIPILLPPVATRKAITSIATTLTDKIQLNHQINQTLEQMAQAIFKSWFVNFEPVKAKIAALEAGLPAPRKGIFYTYALECGDGSLYIGQTDNLRRRWHEHRMGKGAQWTKARLPLRIAHFEECDSRECAVAKEKEWKTTAGRRNLKKLIANGAARQAGGSEEDTLLAAMQAISGNGEAELTRLQAEQPEQYAELRATAELFPSAMQDSELGEIPEGWNVSQIGDEVTVVGGGTPSTKNPVFWEAGQISWTSPKDLSNLADKVLVETERKITEAGLAKISSGLLPIDTVLMSSRAPVGYLALAKIPVAVNQGYIAMRCEKILTPAFVIQWCQAHMDEIKSRASGTTFAEISKKNFKIIPVVAPPESLVSIYSRQASSLYETIENNVRESDTLAKIRDSLLPKLLTGEISILEAEDHAQKTAETADV